MHTIHLHINGLTHRDIAARREAFVETAVGRSIVVRPACLTEDKRTVEAFVGADCVGVVSRMSLDLAWSALRGEAKNSLRGCIVKAEPYDLTMECVVGALAELPQEDGDLSQWTYTGRTMPMWPSMRKMDYLSEEMQLMLSEPVPDEEDFMEMMQAFCDVAPFDLSLEGQDMRKQLLQQLEKDGDEASSAWRARAVQMLMEVSRRMGGNTWKSEFWMWMRSELSQSAEVQMLLADPLPVDEMVDAARRLPLNLWEVYKRDGVQFLNVLYGIRPSRESLLRVLSCLMWLDAHTVEADEDNISLDDLAERIVWEPTEELRRQSLTVVNNLLSDNPQWASRVSYIKQKMHEDKPVGNTFINPQVTMQNPTIDGPMYEISGNDNINLGGTTNGKGQ